MTVRIVQELTADETKAFFHIGIILRKDGWYNFYSDGQKNYTLIKKNDVETVETKKIKITNKQKKEKKEAKETKKKKLKK